MRSTIAALGGLLLACTDGRDPGGEDAGRDTMCRYEFTCENGACACSGGDACCDPDVCGVTALTSCRVLCEVCTCEGGCLDAATRERDAGIEHRSDAGPVTPECGSIASACWDDCASDHGTCAERCGPGARCWDECSTDHGTCAERCGAGCSCWSECSTDHGTCSERCGPGARCWSECSTDHGTCAGRCGPGDSCWDACSTDHGTCAERCGPGARCWEECSTDTATCTERCGPQP